MTELATFTEPRPYRWTVEDYLALAAAGAFDRSGRIELIEGEILEMAPMQSIHGFLVAQILGRLLNGLAAIGSDLQVYAAPTLRMTPDSAPEPDVVVTTEAPGFAYLTGEQAMLLVEIANTTLEHDLVRKAALYARSGVPEYWVLEVQANCIHRHWSPTADGYGGKDVVALGERCHSLTVAGLGIATDGLAIG